MIEENLPICDHCSKPYSGDKCTNYKCNIPVPKLRPIITFYQRSQELICVISEEFGEMIKEINNYNWKKDKTDNSGRQNLKNAIEELKQLYSPLEELKFKLLNELDEISYREGRKK